eukprot:TRINITY_DN4906_c0_g1_i2.p1 TRINITY_DN4906_c0_g1~~TRINITY_DN4906_c0_g1_i2.p1  ORF type:complete len:163 (+),score=31.86 TRINITY_DN4906_c0_g1_i2:770-1258(+)
MPPKKETKDKKPEKVAKKPPRAELCECGMLEELERDPSWARDDPRRGWVRVVAPVVKGKKKKKGPEAANHNVSCTYQRAPCAKYPHLPKCPACAEGCTKCEKIFPDCPDAFPGPCRKCTFMYKRDVLRCSTPLRPLPLGSLIAGLRTSLPNAQLKKNGNIII